MTSPTVVSIGCALLSLATVARRRFYWPVAAVLCLIAAWAAAGELRTPPPEFDFSMLAAVACAQGWAYSRAWQAADAISIAFDCSPPDTDAGWALLASAVALLSLVVPSASEAFFQGCFFAASVSGSLAWHVRALWLPLPRAPERDACVVLLLGDCAGVLFGWRDDALPWQAAMQLGAVSVVQLAWLVAPPKRRG